MCDDRCEELEKAAFCPHGALRLCQETWLAENERVHAAGEHRGGVIESIQQADASVVQGNKGSL